MHGDRSHRVRASAAFIAVAVALVATGCQWVIPSYASDGTRHNTAETQIGVGNVSGLVPDWSANLGLTSSISSTSAPVVASGVVVVAANSRLQAFSAAGNGCTGSPATCPPLWTTAPGLDLGAQPIIVGDRVLLFTRAGAVHTYDLHGDQGCSGTPKVCAPLGTASDVLPPAPRGWMTNQLTVADGVVYAFGPELRAFGASDLIACVESSAPCSPRWTFDPRQDEYQDWMVSHVVIAGGTVFVGVTGYGFETEESFVATVDAAGVDGCSGSPVVCTQRGRTWYQPWGLEDLAVADGVLVASVGHIPSSDPGYEPDLPGSIRAYSAGDCEVGTCAPTWTTPLKRDTDIAVADGAIFLVDVIGGVDPQLAGKAFDLFGNDGCSGEPVICEPLRTMPGTSGTPIVANGVVYIGTKAFDAGGSVLCQGAPVTCSPLHTSVGSVRVVVNGRVHGLTQSPAGSASLVTERAPG